MGTKISRCLGLQSSVQVYEDYTTHPGLISTADVSIVVACDLDEAYNRNPKTYFDEGSDV